MLLSLKKHVSLVITRVTIALFPDCVAAIAKKTKRIYEPITIDYDFTIATESNNVKTTAVSITDTATTTATATTKTKQLLQLQPRTQ